MSVDKTLKDKLGISRPSKKIESNKTPISKIVTETKQDQPKMSDEEIYKRELEEISKKAAAMRILEEEEERLKQEEERLKQEERINKLQESLTSPFTENRKIDMEPAKEYVVEELLPKAQIPEVIDYPEPFEEEPALNRELAEFKKKINQHLHQVGFAGSGGGGIGDIADAGDIQSSTAKVDGKFLKWSDSDAKFVGDDPSVSSETLQDVVGAMVSSNTETGISVTYQDDDGTLDFALAAAQTTVTSLLATDIKIGEDDQTKVDFETADEIHFYAANAHQVKIIDGAIVPASDNDIDLGTSSVEFKNAYFDGTVTSDAFAGPLTGDVTGNADTATALATARNIAGQSFDGSGNITIASTDLSNTSAIALLTASQTLTNKTLTSPQINTQVDMLARAELRFQDSSGGQYVALEAPATVSSNLTLVLPAADGSDGHFLKTDGSGTLSFAAASVSSLAADNLDAGDDAVTLTTSSGNITIDAAANNTDIIFKGTDGGSDTTFLTLDGSEAGAATFNDKLIIKSSHLNQGITQDSTNLFIVLDGTNAASANAGDNIVQDTSANDGDDILHEDFAYLHTGMQREVLEIRNSGGTLLKSMSGFAAGAV